MKHDLTTGTWQDDTGYPISIVLAATSDDADQAVRCRVHRPVWQVLGYPICHWTPPSGKYSPHIALADAMVINFWHKKLSCGIVVIASRS